jgi:guanosine-3',5'-bis(diphosphate) 3'-pyrophosphohydrolase
MPDNLTAGAEDLVGDSELVADAYQVAREAHEGQQRKDNGAPYLTHPLRVAELVSRAGLGEEVVAAAVLHDVVEDSELSRSDISRRFGARVAEIVSALTEDETIDDYEGRKAEHRDRVEAAGPDAVAIYAADKISNLRDMRGLYASIGERAAERFTAPLALRARLWLEDAAMTERMLPRSELARALRAEADSFTRERSLALAG